MIHIGTSTDIEWFFSFFYMLIFKKWNKFDIFLKFVTFIK